MRKLSELIVLIRGGGEAASAIAHRLHRSHFRVCMTELESPLAVSRGVCYSEAVYESTKAIEGVTAELTPLSLEAIYKTWRKGNIPLVINPDTTIKSQINPDVLVDAIMTKRESSISLNDASLVIGVGPGFYAGKNVHLVIESNTGNNLGKVILSGPCEEDSGVPQEIGGYTKERVIWAPETGVFTTTRQIGMAVETGEIVGYIDDLALNAPMAGVVRGLLRNETKVLKNTKLIEIDPVNDKEVCFAIRDKMRSIAGGVLEGIMMALNTGEV